jgi:hypothetical protein
VAENGVPEERSILVHQRVGLLAAERAAEHSHTIKLLIWVVET